MEVTSFRGAGDKICGHNLALVKTNENNEPQTTGNRQLATGHEQLNHFLFQLRDLSFQQPGDAVPGHIDRCRTHLHRRRRVPDGQILQHVADGLLLAPSELGSGEWVAPPNEHIHLGHGFQVDEVEGALALDGGEDGR